MTGRIVFRCLAGAVLVSMGLVACGSSDDSSSSSSTGARTFKLSEFLVAPPKAALHAGLVTITAANVGGETHELVIVKGNDPHTLPTNANGSVDEAMIPSRNKVGEIGGVAAGKHKSKSFQLTAGTYIAFCNVVDDMGAMGGSSSTTMGGSQTTMMGGSSSTMMGGSSSGMRGSGHVHFARGMYATFQVNAS
jgi:hypothetical protein